MQRNPFMEDLNKQLRGPFQWQVQNYPGFSLPKFAKLGRSFQEVKVMCIECMGKSVWQTPENIYLYLVTFRGLFLPKKDMLGTLSTLGPWNEHIDLN